MTGVNIQYNIIKVCVQWTSLHLHTWASKSLHVWLSMRMSSSHLIPWAQFSFQYKTMNLTEKMNEKPTSTKHIHNLQCAYVASYFLVLCVRENRLQFYISKVFIHDYLCVYNNIDGGQLIGVCWLCINTALINYQMNLKSHGFAGFGWWVNLCLRYNYCHTWKILFTRLDIYI